MTTQQLCCGNNDTGCTDARCVCPCATCQAATRPLRPNSDRARPRPGWLDNHRGPFKFLLARPGAKPGFYRSQWLKGHVLRDDVEAEADALLTDPRDTILDVCVWSVTEQQFVGVIRPVGGR